MRRRDPRSAAQTGLLEAYQNARPIVGGLLGAPTEEEGVQMGLLSKQFQDALASGNRRAMAESLGQQAGIVAPFFAGAGITKSVGLPMDTASRMARATEQGFDFDAYHGTVTKSDFDKFGKPKPRGGVYETYFAPEQYKDFANGFSAADQGRIYPVKLNTKNYLDTRKPEHKKIFEKILKDKDLYYDFKYAKKENGPPDLPGWGNQRIIDAVGEAGFDGMFIQERPHMESVAVFNPKTVRSRFAKFDPLKLDSADMLAGVGAGAVAAPVVMGMEREE